MFWVIINLPLLLQTNMEPKTRTRRDILCNNHADHHKKIGRLLRSWENSSCWKRIHLFQSHVRSYHNRPMESQDPSWMTASSLICRNTRYTIPSLRLAIGVWFVEGLKTHMMSYFKPIKLICIVLFQNKSPGLIWNYTMGSKWINLKCSSQYTFTCLQPIKNNHQ